DVIGANEEHPRTTGFRRSRNIYCATAVHRKGQLAVAFASVNIGIGGRIDDPIGPRTLDCFAHLLHVANVYVFRPDATNFILFPLAQQRPSKKSGRAENQHSHVPLVSHSLSAVSSRSERAVCSVQSFVSLTVLCVSFPGAG